MVRQLINDTQHRFMTYDEFITEHGCIIDYLTYTRLIKAIPKVWTTITRHSDTHPRNNTGFDLIKAQASMSQFAHRRITNKGFDNSSPLRFMWERELHIEIADRAWNQSMLRIHKITTSTKLRYFQCRLLNKTLVTNAMRHGWKREISPLCAFCGQVEETVIHILVECQYVRNIWRLLSRWIKYFSPIEINFSHELIILNNYKERSSCMITKQYIYTSKCLNKQLQFRQLITRISYYKKVEEFIAKETVKLMYITKSG